MSRAIRSHRLPVALSAMAWAAAMCAPLAHAGPTLAHWTVTDIGTLGGDNSAAYGINDAGQVAGGAMTAGNALIRAVIYSFSTGTLTDLGSLGGSISNGNGINAAGQVTGYSAYSASDDSLRHAFLYSGSNLTDLSASDAANSSGAAINAAGQVTGYTTRGLDTHAFLYVNGQMVDIGTLGGGFSEGRGINSDGQVVGRSTTADLTVRGFVYSNGAMQSLGTFGGDNSVASGINDAGQITGWAQTSANRSHAFVYSNGVMTDLGTLGGSLSEGHAINAAGQVVGVSTLAGDNALHAFLYSGGRMNDVDSFNGVAGTGWAPRFAQGLNNVGQIVGYGTNPAGVQRGFVLTLDTTVWEAAGSGSWDDAQSWSYGIGPNRNTAVVIDPVRSLAVVGPSGNVVMQTLTVGGDAGGGNGIATLVLNGGTLTTLGNQTVAISPRGVLTGDGTIDATVYNSGTVTAQNVTVTRGLVNLNLVEGSGRINAGFVNSTPGVVRTESGQRLLLDGFQHYNYGSFDVHGGTVQINGAITNMAGGRFMLDGGRLLLNGGMSNSGQVLVSFGGAEVFGNLTTQAGGKVVLSGNSNSTFYDTVDVKGDGELRVSAGSTAVFFGPVLQRTGALFTGTGTKFYEGGLSVGASPGLGIDAGDVGFGGGNLYIAEVAGLAPGTGFDKYIVAGRLSFGGTLRLVEIDGFQPHAGDRFDLFDWGSSSGSFAAIDSSAAALGPGLAWDFSQLYVNGEIGVTAVPEPSAWALWLAGLGVLAQRTRRVPRPARAH